MFRWINECSLGLLILQLNGGEGLFFNAFSYYWQSRGDSIPLMGNEAKSSMRDKHLPGAAQVNHNFNLRTGKRHHCVQSSVETLFSSGPEGVEHSRSKRWLRPSMNTHKSADECIDGYRVS